MSSKEQKLNKINDILTHLSFGIWAVMALWFFQERLYSDTGFYLAKVVHYESFWVELNRFILVFSEWIPLLLIKLGASMKTVLLGYSLGHVLFFYVVYLVARYYYQHYEAGWALLAIQTIGIAYGFCAPGFEFYYGAALLILWAVLLNRDPDSTKSIVLQIILLFFVITSHQITALLFGAIILLHFAEHRWTYWKQYLILFAFVIFLLVVKKLYAHTYDQQKMEMFVQMLTTYQFPEGFGVQFLKFLWEHYKEILFVIFTSTILYLYQKRYFIAFCYISLLAITQYIVLLTYPSLDHSRYQEQCYFPLVFVACFPLFMDIKTRLEHKLKWAVMLAFFGLITYRFFAISVAIEPFTHRVNYMHRVIEAAQKIEGNKFIAHEEWWNPSFGGMSFTIGMESMLLSALDKNRKTIQIIRDSEWVWEDSANIKTLQNTNLYMNTYRSFYDRTDSIYQHKDANTRFFNFPAGKYRFLNGQVPRIDSPTLFKGAMNIKTFPASSYKKQKQANILIHLTTNKQAINSEQVKLAYHWWKDGKVVVWDGIRTPLEFDLQANSEYYQYVLVNLPDESGEYELQVDAVDDSGGIGWLNSDAKVLIKVK